MFKLTDVPRPERVSIGTHQKSKTESRKLVCCRCLPLGCSNGESPLPQWVFSGHCGGFLLTVSSGWPPKMKRAAGVLLEKSARQGLIYVPSRS
jgi:hypothetical protein